MLQKNSILPKVYVTVFVAETYQRGSREHTHLSGRGLGHEAFRGELSKIVLMAISIAMIAGGCNSLRTSGIDPTGEHVFAAPPAGAIPPYPNPYQAPPPSPLPSDPWTIILTPSVTAAVGSEVLLIAGVGSADGYFRCNQRLDWSIARNGVGQFVDIGKNDFVDVLLGDYNGPAWSTAFSASAAPFPETNK